MATTGQNIIDQVRRLTGDRVEPFIATDTEILAWADQAQRSVIELRPDAAILTSVAFPAPAVLTSGTVALSVADQFAPAVVNWVCARWHEKPASPERDMIPYYLKRFESFI